MSELPGIREGREYSVHFYIGREFVGAVIIEPLGVNMCQASLHADPDVPEITLHEMAAAAASALQFAIEKPNIQSMVRKRIEELRAEDEGVEGEPPYPDILSDIPF